MIDIFGYGLIFEDVTYTGDLDWLQSRPHGKKSSL